MNTAQHPLIGLYEKALPLSLDLNSKIQIAKESGYDFIEISIDESDDFLARLDWPMGKRKMLAKHSQDANLPIYSLCLSGQRRFSLGSADKNIRLKSEDMLVKAIDLACDIGARVILVLGYWVCNEPVTSESESLYLEGLARGIERAARRGVMLGIENVDDNSHVNSITKAMNYVRKFNSPWFQLYGDFANLAAFGFDISSELEAGKGHFASIHVKDSILNEVRSIPLGSGIVDFPEAFNTLAAIGYKGPFLLEMWHDKAPDPVASAAVAIKLVQSYLHNSAYHANFE